MIIESKIKPCEEKHLPEILDIFNEAIINSTSLYDYKPRTLNVIHNWYAQKQKGNYPILGVFDDKDSLLGFATYGPFRDRPAYKYTVEHSVYIRSDVRGKGLGTILLKAIVEHAELQDYHIMVAGIDSSNTESFRLHEKEGFVYCGVIKQAGYKFGKWLDLVFYQLILKTPENPEDDK